MPTRPIVKKIFKTLTGLMSSAKEQPHLMREANKGRYVMRGGAPEPDDAHSFWAAHDEAEDALVNAKEKVTGHMKDFRNLAMPGKTRKRARDLISRWPDMANEGSTFANRLAGVPEKSVEMKIIKELARQRGEAFPQDIAPEAFEQMRMIARNLMDQGRLTDRERKVLTLALKKWSRSEFGLGDRIRGDTLVLKELREPNGPHGEKAIRKGFGKGVTEAQQAIREGRKYTNM